MTDPKPTPETAPNRPFANAAAMRRLKKRHAAERRFRLYGQLAISVAMLALGVLVWSIVSQALPAFTKNHVVFDLFLEPEVIAPTGLEDSGAIRANMSGFHALVQKDLVSTFPDVAGNIPRTRELFALVTRLAVLDIAHQTARDPASIGKAKRFSLPLSDDLDLYLKGGITPRRMLGAGQAASMTLLDDGRYTLAAKAPDGFAGLITARTQAGPQASAMVRLNNAWLQVESASLSELTVAYLAGRVPTPGDQIGAPIDALVLNETPANRAISDRQIAWVLLLKAQGRIDRQFNTDLFTKADSTYPEIAGAAAAIVGSIFTMLITAIFALPVGILAAVYLEEFAPKNRITDVIEVNINNLAAVPSIIFGLLGAAVFLNFFGMPRSVPMVGGLVLGLLVMPTVIIASRAALKSVPPSIRTAALSLGASKTQAVFHHTLPLAVPGILTGAIIAMARALGETAPLLLIGMVAFVNQIPSAPDQESTVLPVLIYKWFSGAERTWEPMTSAVILILLAFLITMNLAAVLLRRRFERRW